MSLFLDVFLLYSLALHLAVLNPHPRLNGDSSIMPSYVWNVRLMPQQGAAREATWNGWFSKRWAARRQGCTQITQHTKNTRTHTHTHTHTYIYSQTHIHSHHPSQHLCKNLFMSVWDTVCSGEHTAINLTHKSEGWGSAHSLSPPQLALSFPFTGTCSYMNSIGSASNSDRQCATK